MFSNKINRFLSAIALVLLISACQPKLLKYLNKELGTTEISVDGMLSFDENGEAHYRAKVESFDQKISGQLIFKKSDSAYRAVMITDFGLKVIDLELYENGDYHVKHIMKHMDYNFVKQSFALNLFMLLPQANSVGNEYYSNNKQLIIHAPQSHTIYYFENEKMIITERYRGNKKLWASAEKSSEGMIEIHQTNPEIFISLQMIE